MRYRIRVGSKLTPAAIAAALALSLFAGRADAQAAKDEAKRHFDAGNALLENEDYRAAVTEFETSIGLYPTKMGLFNLANCYKVLRRYGDALAAIERLKSEFAGRLGELEADVAELEGKISAIVGRLEVIVNVDGATVAVDGIEIGWSPLAKPIVLAPGDHSVAVKHPPHTVQQRGVRILAGERRTETFNFTQATPAPAPVVAPPVRRQQPEPSAPEVEAPAPPRVQEERGVPSAGKPLSPTPQEKGKSRLLGNLKPLFWSGVGATALMGVLSCVFYGMASGAVGDYEDYKNDYEALSVDDPDFVDDEAKLWGQMNDASSDVSKYGNLGTGFIVVTGVLAAATTVVAVVAVKKGSRGSEKKDAPAVSATPGGLAVEF